MRPSVGVSKPASILSKVVLPQPDGPSSAKNSPSLTVSETLSTAASLPNRLVTFSKVMMGLGAVIADVPRHTKSRPPPPWTAGGAGGEKKEGGGGGGGGKNGVGGGAPGPPRGRSEERGVSFRIPRPMT